MAMKQLLDGQTTTGQSTPLQVSAIRSNKWNTHVGIIVDGITTGTLKIEFGPTSTGPWEVPTDGELTADGVVVTPASDDMWLRLNVTVATSVDIDAWAG